MHGDYNILFLNMYASDIMNLIIINGLLSRRDLLRESDEE